MLAQPAAQKSLAPQHAIKLVEAAKAEADTPVALNPIPVDNLRSTSFSDPSWANRPDGSSLRVQVHLVAGKEILEGINSRLGLVEIEARRTIPLSRGSANLL